jgi:dTDP-glucose 4,6-dehydratase
MEATLQALMYSVQQHSQGAKLKTLPADDLQTVVQATARLWDEMRDRQMFITGGTGFFGTWLVESFCAANRVLGLRARATVLTRDPERFATKAPHLTSDPAITLIRGDVRDFVYPQGEFTHVVHAAADSCATPPLPDTEMFDTIVRGTQRTLDFARQCGAQKLLLLSSGAVYGTQPPGISRVDEGYVAPTRGAGDYAEGKRAAEALCREYAPSGFECKIARCFAFVGPHLPLNAHFAIGNFIGDALARRCIRIKGDGTGTRSYLYMADAAVWLWTLLFSAPNLRPYNVGSENALSVSALAQLVAEEVAPGVEIQIEAATTDPARASRYVPSTAGARNELGLRETVDLREAIRRTAAWHQRSA